MQCLTLALLNPPKRGEYRVFNQFEEIYSVTELANKVQKVATELDLRVEIKNLENPRIEAEEHRYHADHQSLLDLGYKPTHDVEAELGIMLRDLVTHKQRIDARRSVLIPDVRWGGEREKVGFLPTAA